jgi:flagellar protein FliT
VSQSVLHMYEALANASAEMLDAARRGHWDEVARVESACVVLIAQLRVAARKAQLTREDDRRRLRLMQRILAHDAEVRQLAEPWLDDLDAALSGQRRTLH